MYYMMIINLIRIIHLMNEVFKIIYDLAGYVTHFCSDIRAISHLIVQTKIENDRIRMFHVLTHLIMERNVT
jgi:hypothetical protein